jgi:Ca2+-binding RTX toxin-like protein
MVSAVTIQGSSNNTVSLGFDSKSNFALAEEIAARISAGVQAGSILTATDTSGPPPMLPAGVSGAVIQTQSGLVVLPPGYTTDLVTKAGSAVVFGSGAAGQTILSDAKTDLTFVAAAGSGTVVAGGGDNRLSVSGAGSWSLYTGGGNDIIAALGAVNATIGAGGGDNAILLGYSHDLVISTGDDTIAGGSGSATIDAAGAHSDFVQGNNSRLLFVGGSGGATILGGTGSDTYFGSARHTGKQLIAGGSAGNNLLFAGDGAATLIGGGNNDQLFAYGGKDQLLIAGSGNETLSAAFSAGNDTLHAASGKDLLIGGTGSDTFIGGSGQTTVQAGLGKNVFQFINHAAGGTELVQGIFDPASIKIDLEGYGHNEIDQALASQTVTGGSVTIGLADGTKVTFQDVTKLDRSNFA